MKTCIRVQEFTTGLAGLVLLQACFASTAMGSALQLISATAPEFGPPAGANGDSSLQVISRDGRYVLFASTANNLVALGTNRPLPALIPAPFNVFLRDRAKGSTVLVSVNLDGTGGGNADSVPIAVSTNGRYALFESTASNLVTGDTNDASDVLLRDLVAGTTVLASVSTNGGFADGDSYSSSMTPDGRYVAFVSAADNLVHGDTNAIPDVFVRDLASNVTSLASVGAQPGPNYYYGVDSSVGSDLPALSVDGRYVAFYSTALNLVPGVQTPADVYLRDLLTGSTTWVSADALSLLQSLGLATNAVSFGQVLSDDGRFIAFEAAPYWGAVGLGQSGILLRYDVQTGHTDIIDTNAAVFPSGSFQNPIITPDGRVLAYVANAVDTSGNTTSIRVWDAQSGTNLLASGNETGSVSPGSLSDSPVLDETGRLVAFVSNASDLVTNDIPGDFHIYLRDLQAATATLVDADTNGVGSPIDPTGGAAISADGRFIAFDCYDSNLVPADRNHAYDVFVRNVTNATTELISAHDSGLPSLTPDGASAISRNSLNSDARLIAFWSEGADLAANATNGLRNIYVRDVLTGTNLLVSRNTNGLAGDGVSTDPAISADGEWVTFSSFADDLVSGDTNRAQDVFVAQVPQGAPQLVSINAAGTGPGNADSYSPTISSNGQFVLFHSKASNLVPGMAAGLENLFWRDLQNHTTLALTTNGVTAADMTPDATFVAFITSSFRSSFSSPSDRLYLWDTQSNSIVYSLNGAGFALVAVSPDGRKLAYATNSGSSYQLSVADRVAGTNWVIASYRSSAASAPRFSADGRSLVYVAGLGALPSTNQVYLYDFTTGTNLLISHSSDGSVLGDDDSDSPDLSPDGRLVAYRSAADNLVAGDNNGVPDVFLYDRQSGSNTLITASRFGNASADNRSLMPVFSLDGRTLVFESWASDLIPNDFNNESDVFALSLDTTGVIPSFAVTVQQVFSPIPYNLLSWPAVGSKSYRVQFKNHLNDLAWQDLTGPISVMGNEASFKDDAVSRSTKFYRVLAY